jgi:hypothetical protein
LFFLEEHERVFFLEEKEEERVLSRGGQGDVYFIKADERMPYSL